MRRVVVLSCILLLSILDTKGAEILGTLNSGMQDLRENVGNCLHAMNNTDDQRAIGFVTPGTAILLENLILRLENSVSGGDPVVTLKANDNGGLQPGTILQTFINPTLNDANGDYLFTLTTPFSLTPNTQYWIDVDHNDNTGCFKWLAWGAVGIGPPTGVARMNGNHRSTDDGVSYSGTGPLPVFQLNGTIIQNPIPTISQWGIIILCLLVINISILTIGRHNQTLAC